MKPVLSWFIGPLLVLNCANSDAVAKGMLVKQISDKLSEHRCRGMPVDVIGATTEERQLICAASEQAAGLFKQCGLANMPLMRVQVTKEPPHVCGVDAFGSFDANAQSIRLVNTSACRRLAIANPTYALLPFVQFYKSLAVHEIAHQMFRSHLKGKAVSHATHEYVAYAIQIASMPLKVRTQFLDAIRREPPSDLSPFVDMVLLMSPAYFAAIAYDHFSAPGNGYRIIRGVLQGTIEFPANDLLE